MMSGTGNTPTGSSGRQSVATQKAMLSEILDDPSAYFATPEEVLAAKGWSREDKRQILESWKQDAVELDVATSENMGGGENIDLKRINNALLELEHNQ